MNTNNTLMGFVVLALVIGGFAGFHLGKGKDGLSGMHKMPDGSMMHQENMTTVDMMASMNAELSGKTGDDFDKAFLNEMIMHHEGAVGMAKAALTNANHQEIKDLALTIISAQNQEISQMKEWLKTWYNQ